MNQTQNRIQNMNLTPDELADFNFDQYQYQFRDHKAESGWTNHKGLIHPGQVYRLIIQPEKWYYTGLVGADESCLETGIIKGDDIIANASDYDFLRPATEAEIPKPATQEDRVKAEYGDYDVVILEFDEPDIDGVSLLCVMHNRSTVSHVLAQSMKGFYEYVYFDGSEFYTYREPTDELAGKTITPIAVLFVRGEG